MANVFGTEPRIRAKQKVTLYGYEREGRPRNAPAFDFMDRLAYSAATSWGLQFSTTGWTKMAVTDEEPLILARKPRMPGLPLSRGFPYGQEINDRKSASEAEVQIACRASLLQVRSPQGLYA